MIDPLVCACHDENPYPFWKGYLLQKFFPALALLTAFVCTAPAAAQSYRNNEQRQNFLLSFFDKNEEAALYHRYCGGDAPTPASFKENNDRVGQILLNELIRQSPDVPPKMVRAALREHQNELRYNLEKFYMRYNCSHPQAVIAKDHYDTLISVNIEELEEYISSKLTVAH